MRGVENERGVKGRGNKGRKEDLDDFYWEENKEKGGGDGRGRSGGDLL